MRSIVIRGCVAGALTAAALAIAPAGHALAATMVEYSTSPDLGCRVMSCSVGVAAPTSDSLPGSDLGGKVNTVAPTSDSLPGSDAAFKGLGG